jgi:phage shock protein C
MMYESHGATQKALYRSRDGRILGVCKGMADYLDFSVGWMRVIAILAALLSGFWPVIGLYLLAALLMKPEPVVPFENDGDREFYDSYASSRKMATQRLKKMFENLDRRIRRMEDTVTARDYDWDSRLNG